MIRIPSAARKRKSWEQARADASELAHRFKEPFKIVTTKQRGKERYHAEPKTPAWKRARQ